MESCCDCLQGLRFNLRMFAMSVESLACVFGENPYFLSNSSKPHSVLKNK